jgi:hypothetical protein
VPAASCPAASERRRRVSFDPSIRREWSSVLSWLRDELPRGESSEGANEPVLQGIAIPGEYPGPLSPRRRWRPSVPLTFYANNASKADIAEPRLILASARFRRGLGSLMGHPIEPLENVGFQFLSLRHRPKRPSFSIASRRSFGPVVRVVLGRTSGPRGGVAEGSRSLMAIFLPTSVPLRLGTELTGPYFRALVRSRVGSSLAAPIYSQNIARPIDVSSLAAAAA